MPTPDGGMTPEEVAEANARLDKMLLTVRDLQKRMKEVVKNLEASIEREEAKQRSRPKANHA